MADTINDLISVPETEEISGEDYVLLDVAKEIKQMRLSDLCKFVGDLVPILNRVFPQATTLNAVIEAITDKINTITARDIIYDGEVHMEYGNLNSIIMYILDSISKLERDEEVEQNDIKADIDGWDSKYTENVYTLADQINVLYEIATTPGIAERLQEARTISISGVTTGSAMFDGTSDVEIVTDSVAYLGDSRGKIYFDRSYMDFGGSTQTTSIYIGTKTRDERPIPTAYYFGDGSAEIHANKFFKDNTNLDDVYSPITHNHDDVYSKLGHTHELSDLNLDAIGEPLVISNSDGTELINYTGSAPINFTLTPESIGAAAAIHGTHVEYDDENKPVESDEAMVGSSGTASTVARSDHSHPAGPSNRVVVTTDDLTTDTAPSFSTAAMKLQLKDAASVGFATEGYCTVGILQGDAGEDAKGKAFELGFGDDNGSPIVKIRSAAINGTWGDWFEIFHATSNVSTSNTAVEVDDSNIPEFSISE